MTSREIPVDDWTDELDAFSKEHEGWMVSVRITDPDGRARTEVDTLPLQGVSVDDPDKRRVAIIVGDKSDAHLTHEIPGPVRIRVDQSESGADCGLHIDAADGSETSVELNSPMRVDEVDGR
jgi:uncharacterized protein DUF5335